MTSRHFFLYSKYNIFIVKYHKIEILFSQIIMVYLSTISNYQMPSTTVRTPVRDPVRDPVKDPVKDRSLKLGNKYYHLFLPKNSAITSSDIKISIRYLSNHLGK